MSKEKFKYLYSFKYKDRNYIYLISKNYPFYFVEYNKETDSLDFPNIEVFKELYTKFYSNENKLSFDLKVNFEKIKERLSDKDFYLTPLVRTTSTLVSLALALTMCGCQKTEEIPQSSDTPSSIVAEQDEYQELYEYFKKNNIDITLREYDDNEYIFVRHFVNSDNKHQITLKDFDEFRDFKNIDFTPTWSDVINAFQENKNIDDEKKNIILNGINNLQNSEELKGIDLSVLYANAKRMNLKYLSSKEMQEAVSRETVYAYFDTQTGTVYLPNDKPLEEFEFIHEVLGHGTLAYREETEESLIVFDCTNHLMLPADNTYIGQSLGIMVSEGGANMIARVATKDRSEPSFYELYEEELRVIAALCNVSLGELFNHKGISLYDLMYQNNINTPVEYIFKMDGIYKGQLYCEFSDLMERLFVDATIENYQKASAEEKRKIVEQTLRIIRNSHFIDRQEMNFEYVGGSINYNFEETATEYEENMNKLKP